MARPRYPPLAARDLGEIRRYIARDNPERARTFVLEIRDHCRRLAQYPAIHPVEPEIDPTVRKAIHGAYLIFYEEDELGILVLRVFHGARDLAGLVLKSAP